MIEKIYPCERISRHLFHLLHTHVIERLTTCVNLFHSQSEDYLSLYQTLKFLEMKYLSENCLKSNIVYHGDPCVTYKNYSRFKYGGPPAIPIFEEAP